MTLSIYGMSALLRESQISEYVNDGVWCQEKTK